MLLNKERRRSHVKKETAEIFTRNSYQASNWKWNSGPEEIVQNKLE
jgi:hypothetical protein